MSDFSSRVVYWQQRHGRQDLPWQGTREAYRIWVSEIMLQQTQVATVIPYFQRFMARFPDVLTLAAADEDSVLVCWSGLGYYARARNLHRAAQSIAIRSDAKFPENIMDLRELPGVGRSTAAAIAVFAYGQSHAILDGNVRRVLTRAFAVPGFPGNASVQKFLWALADSLLPKKHIEAYTQGLMDIGATLCTQRAPRCSDCPLQTCCQASLTQSVTRYPYPKVTRVMPERATRMLLVCLEERLLLEKRPRGGIWGGLWSFPEIALADDPVDSIRERWGLETRVISTLPPLRHAFTHYRLHIHPVILRVSQHKLPAFERSFLWLKKEDVAAAAVPTAVRNILNLLGQLAMNDPDGVLGLE